MRIINWALSAGVLLGNLLATSAVAANPSVDEVKCDRGRTIQAAVERVRNRKPDADYVINVSGACVEDVSILNVQADSLVIDGGGTASITGTGALTPVINVSGARQVTIRGFTITNAQNGVAFQDCNFCFLDASNVHVSATTYGMWGVSFGTGSLGAVSNSNIEVSTTTGSVFGVNVAPGANVFVGGTAIQNTSSARNGTGVVIGPNSTVNISHYQGPGGTPFATTTISGFQVGVGVNLGSFVNLSGPGPAGYGDGVIIENNLVGIDVAGARANLAGRVKVRNNTGSAQALHAGIAVSQGGKVVVYGNGGEISGNAGNGIVATHGSYVELLSGSSIINNTKKGLVLATLSSGRINAAPGVATVSGNLGGDQVACDTSSVLTGTSNLNLGGGSINCPNSNPGMVPLP